MRNSTLAAMALMLTVIGIAGCGPKDLPPPLALPPTDPEIERKKEGARYQERLVMDEVNRTHPVLSAAIKGDLDQMRRELAKAPKRINEVRRDLRLGPPLREACKRRWEAGINELMHRDAKCLGDSQCESCLRAHGGAMGIPTTGSGMPSGSGGVYRSGSTGPSGTGSTGGYRLPGSSEYPVPRPSLPGSYPSSRPPDGTMP